MDLHNDRFSGSGNVRNRHQQYRRLRNATYNSYVISVILLLISATSVQ